VRVFFAHGAGINARLKDTPSRHRRPLSLWDYLDYALGKALCFAIAACALFVLIKPGIKWSIKVGLLASAVVAVPIILRWVERLSHEW
jgi:hypothetical protein